MTAVAEREERARPDTGGGWRRLRWPAPAHLALIAVAVAYCLLVVWRTSQSMSLHYDEAVYASQVAREAPAAPFSAPRARGMSLLVAPVVMVTESVLALRLYLVGLAGALMYLAFRPWLAVFGRIGGRYVYVPALAAGCFASLWLTVLYGNLAYPNLWLAFLLVAGTGYLVRAVTEPSPGWGPVVAVGTTFAAAALLRPTDTLATAGPLLLGVLLVRSWRRFRPLVAVVVGLLIGWGAWIIEAYGRFNGPIERLRSGGETNKSGLTNTLPEHLDALGGPVVLCRPHSLCAGVEPAAAVWWFVLPALVAVGVYAAAKSRWMAVGLVVTAAAVAVALPYLFLIDYAAPRFLLPTYGLLMIPAAAALVLLTGLGKTEVRAMAATTVAAVLVLHMGVQLHVLDEASDRLGRTSTNMDRFAAFLRDEGVEPPCLIWSGSAIQFSYQLKCRPIPAFSRDATPVAEETTLLEAVARGDQVVVRLADDIPPPAFLAGWRRVEPPDNWAYVVYLSP